MLEAKTLVLSEDNRVMWAKAGATFPGEKLNLVMTRTLADLPKDRDLVDFYEIRRTDVPTAFDALLKLQNTGLASRYIEILNKEEYQEVLRVEVTLLDAIMLALALLLDVILGMLLPSANASASASGKPPLAAIPATPEIKAYVPTWKRQQQRIGHDEPTL
jgi:hypothetical protein